MPGGSGISIRNLNCDLFDTLRRHIGADHAISILEFLLFNDVHSISWNQIEKS
jgi:hypothetical protein